MQEDMIATLPSKAVPVYEDYEATMAPYRLTFNNVLENLLTERNPRTLMLFWIYFSANGVSMTEPVEDWIKRAGDRCKALGYIKLGEKLCEHAIHEANHHLMMIEDTKQLVILWNQRYTPLLDAKTLLNTPIHETVVTYRDLHEDTINSNHPYGQITIEYEIENLSATYGPAILKHAFEVLGEDIQNALSFVDEHARLDVGHTKYNRKALINFMKEHPEALPELVRAGKAALSAYWGFLDHCYQQAL